MSGGEYTELSGSAQLAYAEVLDNALARGIQTGEGFTFTSQKRANSAGTYWYLQHSLPNPKNVTTLAQKRQSYWLELSSKKSTGHWVR